MLDEADLIGIILWPHFRIYLGCGATKQAGLYPFFRRLTINPTFPKIQWNQESIIQRYPYEYILCDWNDFLWEMIFLAWMNSEQITMLIHHTSAWESAVYLRHKVSMNGLFNGWHVCHIWEINIKMKACDIAESYRLRKATFIKVFCDKPFPWKPHV